ncbi:MAG: SIMPL domain-containing protein [Armatimonadetes bacterium]|nr:SIMPL domain-containing protein [Armatimonadota bacterium]
MSETFVNKSLVSCFIIALILLALLAPSCCWSQLTSDRQPPLLTASGNAEVRVRPDLAIVRLGVESEAKTAAKAREENAKKANAIAAALKTLRIPAANIETSTFQISPVRRFPEGSSQQGQPPIVGYSVTNIVTVRTGQLDLVPRIIDDSVVAGANEVQGVDFVLQNDSVAKQQALKAAVANARENARTMANELGLRLVQVRSIQQGGVGVVPPPIFYRLGAAAPTATTPTPIFPGEVTINASVTLTYSIR